MKRGFSLIELLIVLTIILILAAIAVWIIHVGPHPAIILFGLF